MVVLTSSSPCCELLIQSRNGIRLVMTAECSSVAHDRALSICANGRQPHTPPMGICQMAIQQLKTIKPKSKTIPQARTLQRFQSISISPVAALRYALCDHGYAILSSPESYCRCASERSKRSESTPWAEGYVTSGTTSGTGLFWVQSERAWPAEAEASAGLLTQEDGAAMITGSVAQGSARFVKERCSETSVRF